MDAEFLKYHTLISKNCVDIDEYIKVLNLPEDDAAIEAEMKETGKEGIRCSIK